MSVVVRMEMPKNCKTCPFRDGAWCLVPGDWRERYTMPDEGRSEHCPIICSIPEGHGDLIDRDVLLQTFQNADYETYNDYCEAFDTTEAAETIVPAEAERSET